MYKNILYINNSSYIYTVYGHTMVAHLIKTLYIHSYDKELVNKCYEYKEKNIHLGPPESLIVMVT